MGIIIASLLGWLQALKQVAVWGCSEYRDYFNIYFFPTARCRREWMRDEAKGDMGSVWGDTALQKGAQKGGCVPDRAGSLPHPQAPP